MTAASSARIVPALSPVEESKLMAALPTRDIRTGGDHKPRTFDPTPITNRQEPAVTTPEQDTAAATDGPDGYNTALLNAAALVANGGTTPEQEESLREVNGAAEQFEDLRPAARALDDALTQAATERAEQSTEPVFTKDGRVHLERFVDRHLCDADARSKDTDLAAVVSLANAATVTAQIRAFFPRIVIEETTLDEGVPMMFRDLGNGMWRLAWDPQQFTRAQVETAITIYIAGAGEYVEYTPAVYRALRGLTGFRASADRPEVVEFWDTCERAVIASNDPAAAVARIGRLISEECAGKQADGEVPTAPPEGEKARLTGVQA